MPAFATTFFEISEDKAQIQFSQVVMDPEVDV